MLALMHEAVPYGHLLISGISPTDAQLAVLAGAPSDQIPALLGELEAAGVFSRTRSGAIYSRRMTRDLKKAEKNRKNGKLGGNPSLCNNEANLPWDNPPDNQPDKAKKLEARNLEREIPPPPIPSPPQDRGGGGQRDLVSERDQILIAAKIDVSKDTTGKWFSSETLHEIGQWAGLGLDLLQILTTIQDVMRSRDGPPGSLRYFRTAMQRAAGRKAEAPLAPIADASPPAETERMKRLRRLGRYGDA